MNKPYIFLWQETGFGVEEIFEGIKYAGGAYPPGVKRVDKQVTIN